MPEPRRFVLLTYGSRGDVEPFIALAVGLRRFGHAVRLVAPGPFEPLARTHAVDFVPLQGDPEELALALTDRAGLSWPRMVARMVQHILPLSRAALRTVQKATSDAEVIIHSFLMTDAGHTLAQARSLPEFSAQLFPTFIPTSEFTAVALPDLPLGGGYRRLTHLLNTAMFRWGGRLLYAKVRASEPEFPHLAPWPFPLFRRSSTPILFGYSPQVLRRPADWPGHAYVTGYWSLDPPPGWSPPESLVRFLENGPPPVYFGAGSMRTRRMPDLLRAVVEAVLATDQRAVLGVSVDRNELPRTDRVFSAQGVPHQWLFPRMRMVLHHGGAGTTGAALRAGIPSTAIPFTADQAFWARQARRLGVGPPAPPIHRLTSKKVVSIIEKTLTDPSYRTQAEMLGARLRQEDGVATAIGIIHRHLEGTVRRVQTRVMKLDS